MKSQKHRIEVTIDKDLGIRLNFVCDEPNNAFCHLHCPQECDEWTEDHDAFEDHALVDYGQCVACESLNEQHGVAESACYMGEPEPLRSGPIRVEWEDAYWWEYQEVPLDGGGA